MPRRVVLLAFASVSSSSLRSSGGGEGGTGEGYKHRVLSLPGACYTLGRTTPLSTARKLYVNVRVVHVISVSHLHPRLTIEKCTRLGARQGRQLFVGLCP